MADQIIPLDNTANQSFTIQVSVDGNVLTLQLQISFAEMAQYWVMNILDVNGNLLLASIPMITGEWPAANLLAQYAYLGIGSAYIINAAQAPIDYPDSTSLGSQFVLLWSDTAE